jgi:hypothetical protein
MNNGESAERFVCLSRQANELPRANFSGGAADTSRLHIERERQSPVNIVATSIWPVTCENVREFVDEVHGPIVGQKGRT